MASTNLPTTKPFELKPKEAKVANFYTKLAQIAHAASLGRYSLVEFGGIGQEPQYHEDLGVQSVASAQTILKELVIAARPVATDLIRDIEFIKGDSGSNKKSAEDHFHE